MRKGVCVTIVPVRRLSGDLETEHNTLHLGLPRPYNEKQEEANLCDRGGTGLVQFVRWD